MYNNKDEGCLYHIQNSLIKKYDYTPKRDTFERVYFVTFSIDEMKLDTMAESILAYIT